MKRRTRRWALAMLVLYVMLIAFGGCADRIILIPTTHPINAGAAEMRTIPFRAGVLEFWTARSEAAKRSEPAAYLLEFTGNGTRAESVAAWIASRWGDRAVEVWVMNYPGYGGSTGPARL